MANQESSDKVYQSPSLEQWGTVTDLTATEDVGNTNDTMMGNMGGSNDCPDNNSEGSSNSMGCGGV